MMFPHREVVEEVRKRYPKGSRVVLVRMDDVQAPPVGTKGTVVFVDDTATIHVEWDNGSTLGVVYGEDSCRKLDSVRTICYGKEKLWDSREEAMEEFLMAMAACDGSEGSRYAKIYSELAAGKAVCTD